MTNRLGTATSPYLRQRAGDQIHWWPWGAEAFAEARQRQLPVLLSVGYACSHLAELMGREIFLDPAAAAFLNANFIAIAVDGNERPDIAKLYLAATQAMTARGGTPLTCFLTPEGEPFHCGTYYPPAPRDGLPAFPQVVNAIAKMWREQNIEVRHTAQRFVSQFTERAQPAPQKPVTEQTVSQALARLQAEFDREYGGFGAEPKFPLSSVLDFLSRHYQRTKSPETLTMLASSCVVMARRGIYDQVAGGFAKYTHDRSWVLPNFEKTLDNNASLLNVYTQLAPMDSLARRVAQETGEFILTELRTAEGGFAAGFSAATQGYEGWTYCWSLEQLHAALGPDDGAWAANLLHVSEQGNFAPGLSVLQLPADPDDRERWARVRATLRAARNQRPQPVRDDTVVTAWNGLAIAALAEAGAILAKPEWVQAARSAAEFIITTHFSGNRLLHSSIAGVAQNTPATLEDYACLADAFLALGLVTRESDWFKRAIMLVEDALNLFADRANPGVYYYTGHDAEQLFMRYTTVEDGATATGAGVFARVLLTTSKILGTDPLAEKHRQAAIAALSRAESLMVQSPRFAGSWLTAAEGAV